MNNEIVVRIPHRHTQEEATRRIRTGIDELRARYGDRVAALETKWDGPRMDGRLNALGQTLSGSIEVEPTVVVVTVQLPWLLAVLKERILGFVQKNGDRILQIK